MFRDDTGTDWEILARWGDMEGHRVGPRRLISLLATAIENRSRVVEHAQGWRAEWAARGGTARDAVTPPELAKEMLRMWDEFATAEAVNGAARLEKYQAECRENERKAQERAEEEEAARMRTEFAAAQTAERLEAERLARVWTMALEFMGG